MLNKSIAGSRSWLTLSVAAVLAVMFLLLHSLSAGATEQSEARTNEQPTSKTHEDFIDAVWTYESDIDPSKQDYYNSNWNKSVASYPKVEYPGRVVRDTNGDPVIDKGLTIKELFETLGISAYYSPSDPHPDWKLIQSNVVNYLGFVGFQFQESDLVDTGYYIFPGITIGDKAYPTHYVDLPNYTWADGRRSFLVFPPTVNRPTLATDTVTFFDWYFTGKDGIHSYHDFTQPDNHVLVIKSHFANKYDGIVSGLAARGKQLADYLGTSVYWSQLDPSVNPPPGNRSDKVEITLSGLLAGAHLRGATGVIELLVDHKNPADENGTYILQYVQDYAGYDTPFPDFDAEAAWVGIGLGD